MIWLASGPPKAAQKVDPHARRTQDLAGPNPGEPRSCAHSRFSRLLDNRHYVPY